MRQACQDIADEAARRFTEHDRILPLWQTMAENMHPMRADFTRVRSQSEEFASFLMTGRPAMAFRELQNSLSGMLRPRDQQWFHPRTHVEKLNQAPNTRGWLDWAGTIQRRIMYDPRAQFVRSTKEGDGDFCLTGQTAITIDPNRSMDGLLYRTWHLRDVAWAENVERAISRYFFKWTPTIRQLQNLFKNNEGEYSLAPTIQNANVADLDKTVNCRRMIIPADDYDLADAKTRRMKWVSIIVDIDNKVILEEVATRTPRVVLPRWVTVSGSPIAYSPPAVFGLPDARMLQEITLTILEAGQKAVDPPMIAVGEAINGAVNVMAGGITQTDADYDEREGEVLRPMTLKLDGLQFAANREDKIEKALDEAFFRNRIGMPTITKEMTATETQKVYEDFIRGALPLFEPVEVEYNAALCAESFDQILDMGGFGSIYDMPQELRNQDLRFDFDSPLQAAADRAKVGYFQSSIQIVSEGAQLDANVRANFDVDKATRDALGSNGSPVEWIRSEDDANAIKQKAAQQQQAELAAQNMANGADVATKVASAGESAGRAAQMIKSAGLMQ